MTKSHKKRVLSGQVKIRCRCHPCVLRHEVLTTRRTDPYKIVRYGEHKGNIWSYYNQAWLQEDLFEDMFSKKISQEMALELTGAPLLMQYYQRFVLKKQ